MASKQHEHHHHLSEASSSSDSYVTSDESGEDSEEQHGRADIPGWDEETLRHYVSDGPRVVVIINQRIIDVTSYLGDHVSYRSCHLFPSNLTHIFLAWRIGSHQKVFLSFVRLILDERTETTKEPLEPGNRRVHGGNEQTFHGG